MTNGCDVDVDADADDVGTDACYYVFVQSSQQISVVFLKKKKTEVVNCYLQTMMSSLSEN